MQKQHGLGVISFILFILILVGLVAFSIYLVRLDNTVRERFEGQRWDIPAKVFARPLELFVNSDLTQADLIEELKLLGYKQAQDYKNPGTYLQKGQQLYIHTRGFDFGDSTEPERVLEINFHQGVINAIRTTKPSDSGVVRLEPMLIGGIYPQHKEDRVLIQLAQVPQPLIDALIATEDRNFYQHYGVSVRGTARALLSNVTGGKRQGGSTLTQQLVKNFYLTPERTYKRKINEALMALLVEFHYDKKEILEAYLNEVNLGQNGNYSINGYGLASQFYFGQPLRELNISQQAFLVGLVNGPSFYNPWKHPERATERRNLVLHNMLVMNKLTQQQYETEIARPLGIAKKPAIAAVRFPDFMDIVRRQLREEYQESDLTSHGLRIFTTLDPVAQTRIQNSFNDTVARLVKNSPKKLQGLQGAVAVSHPENGELVAVVGSTGEFTGFNRVVDAKRQVGSLLKPVIYMHALQTGRYNWATQINDSNVVIRIPGQKEWQPKNYSGREYGLVTMETALANSYNLSAVRIGWEAGLQTYINNLHRLGIDQNIPSYPSVLLGAINLSPLDILKVYQNFATGGFNYPVRTIRSVFDANGNVLQRYGLQVQNSIDINTAYMLDHGLQQVMSQGTGKSAYNILSKDLKLAGKSGTTNDARDSWFAGYSGNYLAVVWLGDDNNKPIGLTGSTGALPVWTNVMKQLKNRPNERMLPSEVSWQWIDSSEQLLSAPHCAGALYIPMLQKTIPRQATSCSQSYYEIPTEYDSQPSTSPEPHQGQQPLIDPFDGSYIRESEPTPPPREPEIISQGSYEVGR